MKRVIKFRGKRVDNGKWVFGGIKFFRDEISIIAPYGNVADFNHEVIPETVGQYICLNDKHGVEIYEDDVVMCTKGCPHKVEWRKEHGGTFIGGMPTFYLSGLKDGYAWTGQEELAGNIHDDDIQNLK